MGHQLSREEQERLTASIAPTTNAAVNTNTVHTILAAPGAGFRYRLYHASLARGAAGLTAAFKAADVRCSISSPALGTISAVGIGAGQPCNNASFGDNGIPLAANEAIQGQSLSDVASVPIFISVQYIIEDI